MNATRSTTESVGFKNTYFEQLEGLYIPVEPRGFSAPRQMTFNEPVFEQLGLPERVHDRFASFVSGNWVPEDARPLAMAYAGHQFGNFNPSLGDGRALVLGEVEAPDGVLYDIQLKGSGRTPFSRGGDGFAAVGPILREHLVSEAMHRLGIRTTRVLGTARTGERIQRQELLDGAVLARVAESHVRVGTFQFFAAREDEESLARLIDYTARRFGLEAQGRVEQARALLESVSTRQAKLVAEWLGVGFVHGVMNTDNFSASGETIDYGPCAFLDTFDPRGVFSSIDRNARYAYANQPGIAQWNLARLAEALLPFLDTNQDEALDWANASLRGFAETFEANHLDVFRRKLGILTGADERDAELVDGLLSTMHRLELDFTSTFRKLASSLRAGACSYEDPEMKTWFETWSSRVTPLGAEHVADAMDAVNPVYIPRNHLVEEALEAAIAGDMAPYHTLHGVLGDPYKVRPGLERYAEPAPEDFGPYVTFCGT